MLNSFFLLYFFIFGGNISKLFGTDGIRGVAMQDLTPEKLLVLGRAIGIMVAKLFSDNKKIILGYDTRTTSELFANSITCGVVSQGVDVCNIGLVSTPVLAYVTKHSGYPCGVMITASHNAPQYNGIKLFGNDGRKLNKQEEQLQQIIDNMHIFEYVKYDELGSVSIDKKSDNKYISSMRNRLRSIDRKVVFDCANGATSRFVKKIFSGKVRNLDIVNTGDSGLDVNVNCGATCVQPLQQYVADNDYDIGISFDGDGDRIIIVDKANVYDGDDLLYILASCQESTVVVGTIMANFGVEKALQQKGIQLIRTPVGDKHILQTMNDKDLSIGGEQAGHIIMQKYESIGDGIAAAIEILNILGDKLSLSSLTDGLVKYPQVVKNVSVKDKNIIYGKAFVEYLYACESLLLDSGRIVVRPSGTEPVIRVMVEAYDEQKVDLFSSQIVSKIKELDSNC